MQIIVKRTQSNVKQSVGNKAKGRISKRVFREDKAWQIFRKAKEMFVFWNIWRALSSRNTRFEIRPFALLPTHSTYEI